MSSIGISPVSASRWTDRGRRDWQKRLALTVVETIGIATRSCLVLDDLHVRIWGENQ
jgi:hypothetical protein